MRQQWQDWQELLVRPGGKRPVYHCLLAVREPARGVDYHRITGQEDERGSPVVGPYRFRVASITKIFTATLVLQLLEAGRLRLEDRLLALLPAADRGLPRELLLVGERNYSAAITVDQLLRHRSGLCDYFADDPRFFAYAQRDPDRQWSWRDTLARYLAAGLHHRGRRPGTEFHYADTNYLLLAVLVEALTGKPFGTTLRERILAPLDLRETYLEFFEPAGGSLPLLYPYLGKRSLRPLNTSFDWGGGGLVAPARDLDRFIRALFAGDLFRRSATLQLMLPAAGEAYGRGLQVRHRGGIPYYGHTGFYGNLLFYQPDRGQSVVVAIQQAAALGRAEWLLERVLRTTGVGDSLRSPHL